MVDFTQAQIQTQTASPSGPSGYQRAPGALESLASLASALAPNKSQLDAVAKKKAEAKTASVTELYSQEALKLADAVDMGEMSSGVARARMRRLYSTYIANNPLLQEDLYKVHNNILSTSGLGRVVAEGTEEEQREAEFRDEVYKAGFINESMSPEKQDEMIGQYRSFKVNERLLGIETQKLAFANAEITNIRGKLGIESDRLGLQRARMGLRNDSIDQQMKLLSLEQKKAAYRAEQAMVGLANDYGPVFRERASAIISDLPENASPEMRAQAERQLQELWSGTVGGVVGALGAGASTGMVDMATKPMKDWFDYSIRVARGEDSLANLNSANNIAIQRETFNSYLDPEVRALATTISMFGETVALSPTMEETALRAFTNSVARNSPPSVTDPDYNGFMGFSMETLEAAALGNLSEASTEEATTNLNNILSSLSNLSSTDAESLNDAAENLSSPQFGTYVEKIGFTGLTREAATGAKNVFDEFYVQEVVPLIREEWQQATYKQSTGQTTPSAFRSPRTTRNVQENMRVDFSGSGVRFSAVNPEGMGNAAATKLNREVAPVLNKLIRLGSHLDGHTNYRRFFEQNYSEMFQTEVLREDNVEG